MDKKTSRQEKLQLLQAIREGRVNANTLGESINFIAMESIDHNGEYTITECRKDAKLNRQLNPDEFKIWRNQIETVNKHRTNPHKIIVITWAID